MGLAAITFYPGRKQLARLGPSITHKFLGAQEKGG